MGNTTVLRQLEGEKPRSETQFRKIQAKVHRMRGRAGDEAWAKVHEQAIQDIRSGAEAGTTLSLCPACLKRGSRTMIIEVGGARRCGSCGWTETPPSGESAPPTPPPAPPPDAR